MFVSIHYPWGLQVEAAQECTARAPTFFRIKAKKQRGNNAAEDVTLSMGVDEAILLHKRLGSMLNAHTTPARRKRVGS